MIVAAPSRASASKPRKRARLAAATFSPKIVIDLVGSPPKLRPILFEVKLHATTGDLIDSYLDYRAEGVRDGSVGHSEWVHERIDLLLRRVQNGEDPRVVFRLGKRKKRGARKDVAREQNMCMEVLRLTRSQELTEARAKGLVAQAFSIHFGDIDIKTIERALAAWRNHPLFTPADVDRYSDNLRNRKLLI